MRKIVTVILAIVIMCSCNYNINNNVNDYNVNNHDYICNDYNLVNGIDTLIYNASDSTLYLHGTTKYNIIYTDIEIPCDNLGGTGKIGYFTNRIFYHYKTKQVYADILNFTNIPEIQRVIITYNWCYTLDEYFDREYLNSPDWMTYEPKTKYGKQYKADRLSEL